MELEEMKAKWEFLTQKLSEQTIINETIIKDTLKGKINYEINVTIIGVILYIVMIPLIISCIQMKIIQPFIAYLVLIFLLVGMPLHIYGIRHLFKLKSFNNNLIVAQEHSAKIKKYTIIATIYSVVFVVIVFSYMIFSNLVSALEIYWLLIFDVVIFVGLLFFVIWNCFVEIKKYKAIDKTLTQLMEFKQDESLTSNEETEN